MSIILCLIGLALILLGANYLTDGAVAIAKKLNVSEMIIGLTIVAIGTSMPELVVSVISAAHGEYDISVGNVVGSNIFNFFAILGIVAMIRPIPITRENLWRDTSLLLLSSVVMWAACSTSLLDGTEINTVTRSNGVIMLSLFFAFMYIMIRSSQGEASDEEVDTTKPTPIWLALIMLVGGLGGLVYGGELFIDNIIVIARQLNISESVISITIVAAGTSLPELATSLVAMLKGRGGIALGNIIGSNISNVFLILGVSSIIHPLTLSGISQVDLLMVVAAPIVLLLTAVTFTRRSIDRIEGAVLFAAYVAYTIYLLQ